MNCPKCGGLVEEDRDPESLTTSINCGWRGNMSQENCKKPRCEDPSAPDSVYCIKHRDLKRAGNQRAAARRNGTIKAVRGVVKKAPGSAPSNGSMRERIHFGGPGRSYRRTDLKASIRKHRSGSHVGSARVYLCDRSSCMGNEEGCDSAECAADAGWRRLSHGGFVAWFNRCPRQCRPDPHRVRTAAKKKRFKNRGKCNRR